MSNLKTFFQQTQVTSEAVEIDFDEADDLIEALEHFQEDEPDTLSMEGKLTSFFKESGESFGDQLKGLLRGSGSVQQGFTKVLEAKLDSLKDLDVDKVTLSLSGLAPYFYDAESGRYRKDLTRAVSDDSALVDELLQFTSDVNNAMLDNIQLLVRAPKPRPRDENKALEWKRYWDDKANPDIKAAGALLVERSIGRGLYDTYLTTPKDFDPKKKGEDLVGQQAPVTLHSGKPKAPPSAKRDLEGGVEFTKRDMEDFLKAALDFADRCSESVKQAERFKESYHPINGEVSRSIADVERSLVEHLGASVYVNGLKDVFIPATSSNIATMNKLPMQIVARNLKVLRQLIRFSEKFFK